MPSLALTVDFVPTIDEVRKRLAPKRTRAGTVPWVVSHDLEGWLVDTAMSVARRARQWAPKDTGTLERSIGVAWTGDGSVEVKAGAPYALFVEVGTRPHWPPPGAMAGWARRHNIPEYLAMRAVAEQGTRGWRYMADAWDAERKNMPARIRKLGQAIEARWVRGA
jgi:hypothetical protein